MKLSMLGYTLWSVRNEVVASYPYRSTLIIGSDEVYNHAVLTLSAIFEFDEIEAGAGVERAVEYIARNFSSKTTENNPHSKTVTVIFDYPVERSEIDVGGLATIAMRLRDLIKYGARYEGAIDIRDLRSFLQYDRYEAVKELLSNMYWEQIGRQLYSLVDDQSVVISSAYWDWSEIERQVYIRDLRVYDSNGEPIELCTNEEDASVREDLIDAMINDLDFPLRWLHDEEVTRWSANGLLDGFSV